MTAVTISSMSRFVSGELFAGGGGTAANSLTFARVRKSGFQCSSEWDQPAEIDSGQCIHRTPLPLFTLGPSRLCRCCSCSWSTVNLTPRRTVSSAKGCSQGMSLPKTSWLGRPSSSMAAMTRSATFCPNSLPTFHVARQVESPQVPVRRWLHPQALRPDLHSAERSRLRFALRRPRTAALWEG